MNRTKQNVHKHGKIMSVIVSLVVMLSIVPMFGINAFAFTPRTTAPSKDNEYYYSKKNPFYPNYGLPNCTCYAYGRAYEILGKDPKLPTGNAGKWYETDKTHVKGSTPRLGAIACWKGDPSNAAKNGHVAVVEAINGNKISFSESNYGGSVFQYRKDTDPTKYATGAPYNYKFQGYIYLDDVPEYKPGVINGKFYIKNVGTGTYMGVSGGTDADKTNVVVAKNDFTSKFVMNVAAKNSNAQDGTSIMPGCSKTRVINGFADDVTDGTNVNLYKKTSDASQCWVWEKNESNYVIRNAQHPTLVLTVDGKNVLLKTYTGAKSQLWVAEEVKPVLSSIAVTAPTKKNYYVGEKISTAGMKVTATYADKTTKDVTSSAKVACDLSKAGEATATVSYTENNVTKSASFKVTVNEIPTGIFKGDGTAESPFLISSKAELEKMRDLVNENGTNTKYGHAFYKQTADIDLENENWLAIGKRMANGVDGTYGAFHGNYDGNFHKITGLKAEDTQKFVGLFGSLSTSAVVKNLHVEGDVKLLGADENMRSIGGIVGEMTGNSLITDCSFTGNVESSSDAAGGIVGYIWNGGNVKNCYHNGKVTGTGSAKNIGGIVGLCLVGTQETGKDASINNCYHIGTVKAANGNNAGSAVGLLSIGEKFPAKLSVDNVFVCNDDAVVASNGTASINNIYNVTDAMLKKASDDLGESFVSNDNADINNGFPVFPWESKQAEVTTTATTASTQASNTTTTSTAAQPTTSANGEVSKVKGDANLDGKVSVADAVAILQHLGNRDKYSLKEQGVSNADVDGVAGITGMDALVLQQVDAGLVNAEDLPLKK